MYYGSSHYLTLPRESEYYYSFLSNLFKSNISLETGLDENTTKLITLTILPIPH